jgi:hypothetical protein
VTLIQISVSTLLNVSVSDVTVELKSRRRLLVLQYQVSVACPNNESAQSALPLVTAVTLAASFERVGLPPPLILDLPVVKVQLSTVNMPTSTMYRYISDEVSSSSVQIGPVVGGVVGGLVACVVAIIFYCVKYRKEKSTFKEVDGNKKGDGGEIHVQYSGRLKRIHKVMKL